MEEQWQGADFVESGRGCRVDRFAPPPVEGPVRRQVSEANFLQSIHRFSEVSVRGGRGESAPFAEAVLVVAPSPTPTIRTQDPHPGQRYKVCECKATKKNYTSSSPSLLTSPILILAFSASCSQSIRLLDTSAPPRESQRKGTHQMTTVEKQAVQERARLSPSQSPKRPSLGPVNATARPTGRPMR